MKDWSRVLEVMTGKCSELVRKDGTDGPVSVCIVLDVDGRVDSLLGSPPSAFRHFLGSREVEIRIGIVMPDDTGVRVPDPGLAGDDLAEWVSSQLDGVGRRESPWPETQEMSLKLLVGRGLRWLRSARGKKILLLVSTQRASDAFGLEGVIREAVDSDIRVFVAGPEAPYSMPPVAMMSLGGVRALRQRPGAVGSFCDTRTPDVNLLTTQNVGAVHMWDWRLGDPWIPEESIDALRGDKTRPGVPLPEKLSNFYTFRDWPLSSITDRGPFSECTGIPSIPSGFGYWHLTRLASMTGGVYMILNRRVSRCPFQAAYDLRRLGEFSPDLALEGARPRHTGSLQAIVEALSREGVSPEWWAPAPEGGVMAMGSLEGRGQLQVVFESIGSVRSAARRCRDAAVKVGTAISALEELKASVRRDGEAGPGARRFEGAIDVYRVILARAQFHLLVRSSAMEDVSRHALRDGGALALGVGAKVCRFWKGFEHAKVEAAENDWMVPDFARPALETAVGVSRAVADEWAGTPVSAVARSGALWVYSLQVLGATSGDDDGHGRNPWGHPGNGGPPVVPASVTGGLGE